jgi:hypothetical protein
LVRSVLEEILLAIALCFTNETSSFLVGSLRVGVSAEYFFICAYVSINIFGEELALSTLEFSSINARRNNGTSPTSWNRRSVEAR